MRSLNRCECTWAEKTISDNRFAGGTACSVVFPVFFPAGHIDFYGPGDDNKIQTIRNGHPKE